MTELKTSDEWQKLHPEIEIYDPDGWDRTNYQYSWYEEMITWEEWRYRSMESTCKWNTKLWDGEEWMKKDA